MNGGPPLRPLPPRPLSRRERFRRWRRARPFTAGVLMLVAAAFTAGAPWGPVSAMIVAGPAAILGVLFGVVYVGAAVSFWWAPQQRTFVAFVCAAMAVASFALTNFGGLGIGMICAVVGSALAFAWQVVPPGRPARPVAPVAARQEAVGVVVAALLVVSPTAAGLPVDGLRADDLWPNPVRSLIERLLPPAAPTPAAPTPAAPSSAPTTLPIPALPIPAPLTSAPSSTRLSAGRLAQPAHAPQRDSSSVRMARLDATNLRVLGSLVLQTPTGPRKTLVLHADRLVARGYQVTSDQPGTTFNLAADLDIRDVDLYLENLAGVVTIPGVPTPGIPVSLGADLIPTFLPLDVTVPTFQVTGVRAQQTLVVARQVRTGPLRMGAG